VSWRRGILGAWVAAVVLAGCIVETNEPRRPQVVQLYPDGCADFQFSERQCAAIVGIARLRLAVDDLAAKVELLSDDATGCPTPRTGQPIECISSGGHIAVIVRITAPGVPPQTTQFACGVGISDPNESIACTETPRIRLGLPMDGYHDIACEEDANGNPANCATPLPAIEASATKAARPLTIPALDIPVDHDGRYNVKVGTAGIPNGVLGTARFALAETLLSPVLTGDDGVWIEVRPTDPTHKPFDNYYSHGWYPGVEDADVFLIFDVVWHEAGAVLPIRDLVVR
jgi:hypothetical protein